MTAYHIVFIISEEFRYEAIMVVRKGLNVHKLSDLKGLKSCHTGVGRNVGYKIPITKVSTKKCFLLTLSLKT